MPEIALVLTSMPSRAAADELARTLVAERLAACVAVHAPMASTYRWKGRIERAPERQVVVKTARARLAAVLRRLRELHPYELPEIVVVRAAASPAYAAWVTGETRGGGGRRTRPPSAAPRR